MRSAFAACALALTLPPGQAAFAATFDPPAPSVAAGAAFSTSLIDTVDINDGVGALDLAVEFDPTKLSFVDAEDGAVLPGWLITSNVDAPGEALISAQEPGLGPDAGGTGSIVKLDFVALAGASGPTKVTVAATALSVDVPGEYQLAPTSFVATVVPAVPRVPAPGLACLAIPAVAFALARTRRSRPA